MITTRHSIGMAVLNKLVEDLNLPWHYESRCTGFIARLSTENHDIVFLKPKIPMNINGRSILKTGSRLNPDICNCSSKFFPTWSHIRIRRQSIPSLSKFVSYHNSHNLLIGNSFKSLLAAL